MLSTLGGGAAVYTRDHLYATLIYVDLLSRALKRILKSQNKEMALKKQLVLLIRKAKLPRNANFGTFEGFCPLKFSAFLSFLNVFVEGKTTCKI